MSLSETFRIDVIMDFATQNFRELTLGQNGILRHGHFSVFLEGKIVIFGSTYFQMGLLLNINVNDGQRKFKVQI